MQVQLWQAFIVVVGLYLASSITTQGCKVGCRYDKCNKTGNCVEGCRIGYTDVDCKKEYVCNPNINGTCCSDEHCYNCTDGVHGDNCTLLCPEECKSCAKNFTATPKCYECMSGRYGSACTEHCPTTCIDERCGDGGRCFDCTNGYFDVRCNQLCPANCKNNSCDRDSGMCYQCTDGFYGSSCNMTCIGNCTNNTCFMNNGTCQECGIGYYGKYCNITCPYCKGSLCGRDTGQCFDCVDGFYGKFCNMSCSKTCLNNACYMHNGTCHDCIVGHYGPYCNSTCHSCNMSLCERYTGNCTHGCAENFSGHKCENCNNGTYGENCKTFCPPNCHDGRCHSNGTCVGGCKEGYSDANFCCANSTNCTECSNAFECANCLRGTYGDNCENTCPENCPGLCNKTDGNCIKCPDGLYGDTCNLSCSEQCRNSTCDKTVHCAQECLNGMTDDHCTNELTKEAVVQSHPTSGMTVAVAVGVSIVVVVSAVVALSIVIFLRKRRQSKQNHREKDCNIMALVVEPSNGQTNIEMELEDNGDIPATEETHMDVNDKVDYENYDRPRSKLNTTELCRILVKTDAEYLDEFMNLPQGLIKPYTEAKMSKNAQRNRYNMIYPYDESRVKIDDTHSDYINASYIDGYRKEHAYIACLGPTKKTLGDFGLFWKMIWQEEVEVIVMLTKLKEDSKMKCDQYWPNAGATQMYGEFKVKCTSEELYAEYIIRNMTLKMNDKQRLFHHVHFIAWPDKDVPSDVIGIVNLRNKVNSLRRRLDGPLVVHCSAGVGRTGTYIALDVLTRKGRAEKAVDVLAGVHALRQQRVHMVQTVEQYKFLNHALLWTLTADTEPIHMNKFYDIDWVTSDGELDNMLEELKLENWYVDERETAAVKLNSNIAFANRAGADIPGRRHGIYVTCSDFRQQTRLEYINAVRIDGVRKTNFFIVAQTPLPETVTHFLDMIIQQNVRCIVDLEPFSDQEDVGEYFPPEDEEMEHNGKTFKCMNKQESNAYIFQELEVISEGEASDTNVIPHYQITGWGKDDKFPDPDTFAQFIRDIGQRVIQKEREGTILVHCLNGADRSALFCAIWLLIERLQVDQRVSVANTLRQVKSRRRKALSSKEQLEFCFKCVQAHLRQLEYNVYANIQLTLKPPEDPQYYNAT